MSATIKQKIAFQEIGVNGGNISKAMIKAGYSDREGKIRTDKLTKTKGWEGLMETYLPDSALAKVHKEGLSAVKKDGEESNPDFAVRHKYLESAYKLKGRLKEKEEPPKSSNVQNYNFIFSAETQEAVKAIEATIKQRLINPNVQETA